MQYGQTTKNAQKLKQWCCFRDCFTPQRLAEERRTKYHKSINKKIPPQKISLSKKRAHTCNIDNKKKLDSTTVHHTLSNNEPIMSTDFTNQFYTPQGKFQNPRYHFGNKYESPSNRNPTSLYDQNSMRTKVPSNNLNSSIKKNCRSFKKENEGTQDQNQDIYPGTEKMNACYFKKINFTYKTKKMMEPAIIPYSQFIQSSENFAIKKHSLSIQKTVDLELSRKNKTSDQYTSYASYRLNKEPSKPITLNYSSEDPASLVPQIEHHSPEQESINFLLNQETELVNSHQNKSLQMTNLPTDRCPNSVYGSIGNSRPLKREEEVNEESSKKYSQKSEISKRLSDSENIAYSVNGSDGSEGKLSIIVDLKPEEPLSPHILKIKSERQAKLSEKKKSRMFFLSEIKL